MVEELVCNYLELSTTLVKGTSLFLGGLPGSATEGCAMQMHTDSGRLNAYELCLLTLVMFYNDYTSGREMANSVRDALRLRLGSDPGTFGVLDPVTINYYGTDNLGRNLFAVTFQVCYEAPL